MPSSSQPDLSQILRGFHDRPRSPFQKLNAPRNNLIQCILEKHTLQPVAGVSRWLFTRTRPCLVDIALCTQKLKRQVLEQSLGSSEREVSRMIREWANLVGQSQCSPARMHVSRNGVHTMVNVHGEIQQATGNQN